MVRPGHVLAAAAAVLGGDVWLIGLAWGGDDGASLMGLAAALIAVGILVLAAEWGRTGRRSRPTAATAPAGAAARQPALLRG